MDPVLPLKILSLASLIVFLDETESTAFLKFSIFSADP